MKPHFIISGKLVNLRTTIPSDVDDYERWNNPDLKAWDYDGPWYGHRGVSSAGAKKRLTQGQTPPYSSLEIETADGIHLGWIVIHQNDNDPHMVEFGIDIVEDKYWNKGMGTEAVILWIDYQFRERNLKRIGFSTWSGNHRMLAVGKKLGFVQEACIRNGCEVKGKFYDRIKMGLLREEWHRHRPVFC